jgi:hypothetical protein
MLAMLEPDPPLVPEVTFDNTSLRMKIKDKLNERLNRILAVRYGIEIIEFEKISNDLYRVIAALDPDFFDVACIDSISVVIEFIYSEGDGPSSIVIKKACLEVSVITGYIKPDSDIDYEEPELTDLTYNMTINGGLVYRIVLEAMVDEMSRNR